MQEERTTRIKQEEHTTRGVKRERSNGGEENDDNELSFTHSQEVFHPVVHGEVLDLISAPNCA